MKDRLLTNNEMIQLMWDFAQTVSEEELDKLQQIDRFQMIAAAQLSKTDKEWAEWVENTFGNSIAEYYTEIWAERKRELKTANKINVTLQHQIDIIVRAENVVKQVWTKRRKND